MTSFDLIVCKGTAYFDVIHSFFCYFNTSSAKKGLFAEHTQNAVHV